MKYLSLKWLMRRYSSIVRETHRYEYLNPAYVTANALPRKLFNIIPQRDPETGQITKVLRPLTSQVFGLTKNFIPRSLDMYPILELEWCKETGNLDEESFEVLENIAYAVFLLMLSKNMRTYGSITEVQLVERYHNNMERWNLIVELEDIQDAPRILSRVTLPDDRKMNVRDVPGLGNLFCGLTFESLMAFCTEGITKTHTLDVNHLRSWYAGLPFLYSFFLLDKENTLTADDGRDRMWIFDARQTIMNALSRVAFMKKRPETLALPDIYTCCQLRTLTIKDLEFIETLLGRIQNGLDQLIQKFGVFTYCRYRAFRSETSMKAIVRLDGMRRDWNAALEDAEEEKEEKEERGTI